MAASARSMRLRAFKVSLAGKKIDPSGLGVRMGHFDFTSVCVCHFGDPPK